MRREKWHQQIYFGGLVLLAISLPFSVFTLSVSMFILSLNWLLEGNFKDKFHIIITRKSILFIISIYLIHVLGMINTADLSYGIHDLRIKLPLIILPMVMGSSKPLSQNRLKILLLFFNAAILVSSLISIWVFLGLGGKEITDNRDISLFINHIRYSLLIDIAIFSLLYMTFYPKFEIKRYEKILFGIVASWLILFLFILESFTGIVIFMIAFPIFILNLGFKIKKVIPKAVIVILTCAGIITVLLSGKAAYSRFYSINAVDMSNIEKYTVNGNKYAHSQQDKMLENGNYVWLYVCEKELRKEWNERSHINYDSLDKKGQWIKYTLIRYLTSEGLRKDSAGIASLSPDDIKAVEDGFSNYIFKRRLGVYPRVYQLIWELDMYRKTGNPNGHSLTQRLEYLKNAFIIIRSNIWTGVGTGDVEDEIMQQYELSGSKLDMRWRLRTHNQFVTFVLTFGIAGFVWIMFSLVCAIIYEKKYRNVLFVIFLLIAFLSMVNEDTLETHLGISFFTFFFSLFLYGFESRTKNA